MSTGSSTQPETADRQVAPGRLELVRAFLNTRDVEGGTDEFAAPESMRAWLVDQGLLDGGARVAGEDREMALIVREGLRALALSSNGVDADPPRIAAFDAVTAELVVSPSISDDDPRLVSRDRGVKGALATLIGIVYDSMRDGTWTRLKACRNDECLWLFYDHSKNRSGTWCTMAVCGNVMKARAYRRRRREG